MEELNFFLKIFEIEKKIQKINKDRFISKEEKRDLLKAVREEKKLLVQSLLKDQDTSINQLNDFHDWFLKWNKWFLETLAHLRENNKFPIEKTFPTNKRVEASIEEPIDIDRLIYN
jgi:hypothetical protein